MLFLVGAAAKLEETGQVTASTYLFYAKTGGIIKFIAVTLLILLTSSITAFSQWWLSRWIAAGSGVGMKTTLTWI